MGDGGAEERSQEGAEEGNLQGSAQELRPPTGGPFVQQV